MMDLLSFPDNARVWIYASDQQIPDTKVDAVHEQIIAFTKQWTSHQQSLKATGGLLHQYFLIFVVDDGINKPGGCSIDSSVKFVQKLGDELGVDFFNRNIFYYIEDENVHAIYKDEISSAYQAGIINDNTLFFDSLVQTKGEFQQQWLKPLSHSWQKRFV